jgi:hypothetical protein
MRLIAPFLRKRFSVRSEDETPERAGFFSVDAGAGRRSSPAARHEN